MSSQKENRRTAKQHKKTTPTQRQDREAAVKHEAKITRPSRFQLTDFLPTTKKEVELRGWDQLDVILFSGDAYIDHPAFGELSKQQVIRWLLFHNLIGMETSEISRS